MSKPPATPSPAALSGMKLFYGLPPEALAEVLERGTIRRLARDTVIFVQGQTATRCHALIGGRVRITRSDEDGTQLLVRFIGPGEMFGTVALFTNGEYPAAAVTVLESLEISWPQTALGELIARYPQIALNIVRVIGARLREVQERLGELASQRVERRIAHALLRLAAQAGRPYGDRTTIDFPLTRKDLAEMCGATLHTVSRILTAWERSGLVATRRQRVTIRNSARIQQIAEDVPSGGDGSSAASRVR